MLATFAGAITPIPVGGAATGAAMSALGFVLRCSTCLKLLGVAALVGLTAWHVHSADVGACDARIVADHAQAEIVRRARDGDVAEDLGKTYEPKIDQLAREREALQKKVHDHAKRNPVRGVTSAGKLGSAAGLMRSPSR